MIDLEEVERAIILYGMINVSDRGSGAFHDEYSFQLEGGNRLEIDLYGVLIYSEAIYMVESIVDLGQVESLTTDIGIRYFEGIEEVDIDAEYEDKIGCLFMDQIYYE